ncbi:unnamed protein product [Brachionus calyciflorus]|uniref:M-phase inducer phosphatase n=1 Tax=Brachionus calyciflorus TaxID=104777 RepID=A0A813VS78_9BILA|nr:unnamed protein product [Brachionus calyciflorus]
MNSFRNKRKIEFDSPETKQMIKRNLNFDLDDSSVMLQPQKLFTYIDESSCDSGFSQINDDISDDDITQASNLEDSFTSSSHNESFNSIENIETEPIASIPTMQEEYSNEKLIGDMTKPHTLPILVKSRHSDLASIEPETLIDLINGKYDDQIGKFVIIDARYPYEFNGGHISGAQSGYFKQDLFDKIFSQPIESPNGKPVILVFHCEFSIERGPKLMREFREMDRSLNTNCYPNLFYPEIYLLEGGYKQFYESNQDLCEPKNYVPMLQDQHRNDMKFFRKKSKTWEFETKKNKSLKVKLDFDF